MNTQSVRFSKVFGSILFILGLTIFYPILLPSRLKTNITGIVESVAVRTYQASGRFGRKYPRDYLIIDLQDQSDAIAIPYWDNSDARKHSLFTKITPKKEYTFYIIPTPFSTYDFITGIDQIFHREVLIYQKAHTEFFLLGTVCFLLGIGLWRYARKKEGS